MDDVAKALERDSLFKRSWEPPPEQSALRLVPLLAICYGVAYIDLSIFGGFLGPTDWDCQRPDRQLPHSHAGAGGGLCLLPRSDFQPATKNAASPTLRFNDSGVPVEAALD